MRKRVLSLILTVVLTFSMAANAFASENESITIYLSVCDNGDYVNSPITSEKMAKVPIEISYFDLADYGMEAFYNCETINDESVVIQQPTLLHLFVKATENYYIGETYSKTNEEHKAIFDVIGSAGSASLNRFWNHNYNLAYKIDRANPEIVDSPYLTCDALVLEDGDIITVGMFTSNTWYLDGYYAYFDDYEAEVIEDGQVDFGIKGRPVFGDGTTDVPLDGTKVFAVKTTNPDWLLDENPEIFENIAEDGSFQVAFDTPGTFYITILDLNTGLDNAAIIPDRIKITVNQARALPQYSGDWTLFRKNNDNMGIVSSETPEKIDNAEIKWATQHSASWQEPITSPIIVDGNLYIGKVDTVQKISAETGEVIARSESLAGNIGYGTIPLTYGGGLIFAPVGSGRIQALRADTLESVWVSESLGGQILTPISYKNGEIFCGTWTDETIEGKYFCIDIEDENKAVKTEIKNCKWTVTHTGGFYGAGAYIGDGFSVFGSDNGTEDSNGNAVLYSINTETGSEIARLEGIAGDVRTTIAYDANTASIYFATKEGTLYKVPVNMDGSFGIAEAVNLGGMCTATPIVYDGIVYVSIASADGAWAENGHRYLAIDATTSPMTVKAECSIPGYAQGSAILSTAFEQTTGKLYLYTTYNNNPGGIYIIEITDSGETFSLIGSDLYVPSVEMQNYCSSSLVCDLSGTIYHKNDSGYIMAVKREVPVVITPSYSDGGGGSSGDNNEKQEETDTEEPKTENIEPEISVHQFTDVKEHWALEYIDKLVKKGIIKGKNKTEFAPDDNITRAEFVTLLYRISGEKVENYEGFSDVNASDWYADSVAWARMYGITSGVTESLFAPHENITREQAATFIVRFANYIKINFEKKEAVGEFADINSVSEWAKSAVKIMQSAGIISGKGSNTFAPAENTTRAETAKMLTLVMEMAESL